jgi:putative transposase
MARIARIVVPGYPHHITQRGNRRQRTFFNESDYSAYINDLEAVVRILTTEINRVNKYE